MCVRKVSAKNILKVNNKIISINNERTQQKACLRNSETNINKIL